MKRPTVSVVVCTYNGAQYLPEQLDSILAQTYPLHEIIVQDDQSTDSTPEVLREYAERYPLIRVYRKAERRGISDNFFTAMSHATGDYIALSDQDDVWDKHKIERQMEAIGDRWLCFHPSPTFRGEVPTTQPKVDPRIPNHGIERILFAGVVAGHTTLMKRCLYELIGRVTSDEIRHEIWQAYYFDTMFAIAANAYDKICFVNEPLTLHRRLPHSATEAVRKDLSERTVWNALQMLWRDLAPSRRRVIRPLIRRRFAAVSVLLACLPGTPPAVNGLRRIIECYLEGGAVNNLKFARWLVANRNRIFYASEKNQPVAVVRALLFPIMMYDCFAVAYRYESEGRPDQ